jgi:AhpD family alkylhydroperoxidase
MTTDYKAVLHEIGGGMKSLQEQTGDVTKAFGGLHQASLKDGALSTKHKELMALAIAIHTQCEACIVSHVRSALKAKATPEEIAETVGVAIMMGGGPAVMYGYKALDAARDLA